jgi:hypothetical protein
VVQDVGAVADDGRAVGAHAPVDGHVLVGQALGLGQQGVAHLVNRLQFFAGGYAQQSPDGPGQVDGRRPGRFQGASGFFQVAQQGQPVGGRALPGGQGHAESGRRPDGRRAAHDHVGDALGHFLVGLVGRNLDLPGQQALVDHLHDVAVVVPKYSAHGSLRGWRNRVVAQNPVSSFRYFNG